MKKKEWQIFSAINSCEGRIENGADIDKAFKWLREEVAEIWEGKEIYETEEQVNEYLKTTI